MEEEGNTKDRAPEQADEKAPEKVKEKAPEKVKEKTPEKAAEKVKEKAPEKAKGKSPEKAKETAPAKAAEKAPDKDMKYFVRIRNTDLDGTRSVQIALTKIPGIGRITARAISRLAQVNPLDMMGKLDDGGVERLRQVVDGYGPQVPRWMLNRPADPYTGEGKHLLSTDVLIGKEDDVNRMRKIRCYRGIRHETGQKVRGQRTKSTGRTGTTVGVKRKKE
jgi:small subunit ribosomal protein S13